MPIARIITSDPASAAPVEEQLRGLGYQVELITPRERADSPADLILRVDKCPAHAALKRARKLARQTESDVFVTPGALPESGAHAALANLLARGRTVWESAMQRRREREATLHLARAVTEEQTSPVAAPSSAPVTQSHPDPQILQAPSAPTPEPILPPGTEHLVAPELQPTLIDIGPSSPQESVVAPASATEPAVAVPRWTASEILAPVKRQGRAVVDFASCLALRVATLRLPRLRQRKAPRSSAVSNWRPRLSLRERDWKIAAIVASVVTIAVMLVWAGLENRKPASPIPAGSLFTDVQQQVPFGPATVPAKPAVPLPTAVPRTSTARKPSPLRPRPAKPKPRPRRGQPEDDEVTVRHFRPQRASTQPPPSGGVKRYSDLE